MASSPSPLNSYDIPVPACRKRSDSPCYVNKDHFTRAFQALHLLKKNSLLCDVVLVAGPSPEERAEADILPNEERLEVPAHRAVLAASCPYFYAMFTAEMAEANQKHIYIQGVNPRALSVLIEYMYSSVIHITEENVQILLPAANLLQMTEVRNACCEFLKAQLHPSNCLGIRAFADLHSCDDLLHYANIFTEQNFNEIVQCEEFVSLNTDQFIQLIASDKLTASEEKVFESVMHWVRHDADRRKSILPEVMEYVRLPLLSQEYLVEKVDCDPLIRENPKCKDFLIEALKFHLMKEEQKKIFSSPRARPRTPQSLPKLMFVIGGQAPKAIRNVDVYDFQTERWSQVSELPMRRCRCGVSSLNGLIYAIGGFNGSLRVRTVDVFDPVRQIWTAAPSMDARRSTLGVGVLDGVLYAVGGFDGSSGLNSAEAYDPRTSEWKIISPMSSRRSSVGVAVLNGCVYAIGGYDGLSRQCLSTVERYEPRKDEWIPVCDMSTRRSGPGVAVLEGKLYALGGHDGPVVKKSAELYDLENDVWKPIADMKWCRRNAGVCSVGGSLYSVGGDDGTSNLPSVEIYSPQIDSWNMLPCNMQIGRSYAGVAIVNKAPLS